MTAIEKLNELLTNLVVKGHDSREVLGLLILEVQDLAQRLDRLEATAAQRPATPARRRRP